MSDYYILAVLAAFVFVYSIFASRLERTPVHGALVYLFAGVLCGTQGLGLVDLDVDEEGIKSLAEFTLALVLFTDASNVKPRALRGAESIATRLLLIGLPLTIAAGFMAGVLIFDQLTLLELALLATMLAPTDAALGQAVLTNKAVPEPIRESLNVESGLNDGVCVPVLLIFLAFASGNTSADEQAQMVITLPLQAVGVGTGVGLLLAFTASTLIKFCSSIGSINGAWTVIPAAALALCCFALSQSMGGSGFISAFVGGLLFGRQISDRKLKNDLLRGAEGFGDLMSLLTWFIFGAVAFGQGLQNITWHVIVYALLSLTIVRMLPVLLCLTGAGMRIDSKLFLGWFGPRGLASIVFIVIVIDEKLPGGDTLTAVVTCAVAMSIVGHGLSAVPYSSWYAKKVSARSGSV